MLPVHKRAFPHYSLLFFMLILPDVDLMLFYYFYYYL